MPTTRVKKSKKAKKKSKLHQQTEKYDPVRPEVIVPPEPPREKLMNILKRHSVGEREVYGYTVPSHILEQLTPSEMKDLTIVFKLFDADSDGYLTSIELRRACRALGFKMSREEARNTVRDVSFQKKGYVSVVEFLDVVIDRQGDSADIYAEILKGFDLFDCDKSGKITVENLRQACVDCGVRFTTQELKEMVEEADLNGDGEVDQSEFIKIMLQTNLF